MKKSFKVLKRITGISCPVFGISWTPVKSERDKIKSLITFLEDRRVLFNPFHMEVPIWVSESVIEIRIKITEILESFGDDSETTELLRTMRYSCRRYLDKTFQIQKQHYMNHSLVENLIELRSVFGLCIGKLAIMYGINIEEDLANIIPLMEDSDGKKYELDKKSFQLKT
jgi:hypothetical protein